MKKLNASMSSSEMIGILSEDNINVSDILIRLRNYIGDNEDYKEMLMLLDNNLYSSDDIAKLWLGISDSHLKTFASNIKKFGNPEDSKALMGEMSLLNGLYLRFN